MEEFDYYVLIDKASNCLKKNTYSIDYNLINTIQLINSNIFIKDKSSLDMQKNITSLYDLDLEKTINDIKQKFSIELNKAIEYDSEDCANYLKQIQISTILSIVVKYLIQFKDILNDEKTKLIMCMIANELTYIKDHHSLINEFYFFLLSENMNDKIQFSNADKLESNLINLTDKISSFVMSNYDNNEFFSTLFVNEITFLHLNEFLLYILINVSSLKAKIRILQLQLFLINVYLIYDSNILSLHKTKIESEKSVIIENNSSNRNTNNPGISIPKKKEVFVMKKSTETILNYLSQQIINLMEDIEDKNEYINIDNDKTNKINKLIEQELSFVSDQPLNIESIDINIRGVKSSAHLKDLNKNDSNKDLVEIQNEILKNTNNLVKSLLSFTELSNYSVKSQVIIANTLLKLYKIIIKCKNKESSENKKISQLIFDYINKKIDNFSNNSSLAIIPVKIYKEIAKRLDNDNDTVLLILSKFLESKLYEYYKESSLDEFSDVYNIHKDSISTLLKETKIEAFDINSSSKANTSAINNFCFSISDIITYNIFILEQLYDYISDFNLPCSQTINTNCNTYSTKQSFHIFPDHVYNNLLETIYPIYISLFQEKLIKETIQSHLKYNNYNRALLFHLLKYYYNKKNYFKSKKIIKIILSNPDESMNVLEEIKYELNKAKENYNNSTDDAKANINLQPRNINLLNYNPEIINVTFIIYIMILISENNLSQALEYTIVNLERLKLSSKLNHFYKISNFKYLKRCYYLMGICYSRLGKEALSQVDRNKLYINALNCFEKCLDKNLIKLLTEKINLKIFFNNNDDDKQNTYDISNKEVNSKNIIEILDNNEENNENKDNNDVNNKMEDENNSPKLIEEFKSDIFSVYFYMYIRHLYECQFFNKAYHILNILDNELSSLRANVKEGNINKYLQLFDYNVIHFIVLKVFVLISVGKYDLSIEILKQVLQNLDLMLNKYENDYCKIDSTFPLESYALLVKLLNYLFVLEEKSNKALNLSQEVRKNDKKIELLKNYTTKLQDLLSKLINYYNSSLESLKEKKIKFREQIKAEGKNYSHNIYDSKVVLIDLLNQESNLDIKIRNYDDSYSLMNTRKQELDYLKLETLKDLAIVNEPLIEFYPLKIKELIESLFLSLQINSSSLSAQDDYNIVMMVSISINIYLNKSVFYGSDRK